MGKTVNDADPAMIGIRNRLDSKFHASGADLRDKVDSVKAQLGDALGDRIKQLDAFYQQCKKIGPELTDDQFTHLQVEAARITDALDNLPVASPKPSQAGMLVMLLVVVIVFVMMIR